nr:BLUF domain-containing protein [Methylobacterium sp. OTU13CASTA1]
MMGDLYRLVYASKNLLQGTDAEIAQAVSQILAASQRNNTGVDVTGALMFNAGAFAQVLEGPQRGVETTFERIQCDPRHGDVTVLQCGPAENRSFTNWSMAFVGQSALGKTRWEGIASASGFDLTRLDGDAVFAMLHELVLDEEGLPPASLAASGTPAGADKPVEAEKSAATGRFPTPGSGATLDVARVRAELPQPGQALQARHGSSIEQDASVGEDASNRDGPRTERGASIAQDAGRRQDGGTAQAAETKAGEAKAARAASDGGERFAAKPDAVLTVLRTALAQERQLTTDLRNELDGLRIAIALQQEQSDRLSRERDLWAGRAQLLASAMSQEAGAVPGRSGNGDRGTAPAHREDRSGSSIKAVA